MINLGIGAEWHSFHNHDWKQLQYPSAWGEKLAVWWADVVFDSISTFRLQQNITVNKVQGQSDLAVEDYNSYWSWQELCQLILTLRLGQTVHFQILPFIAYFITSAYSLLLYFFIESCYAVIDPIDNWFEWVVMGFRSAPWNKQAPPGIILDRSPDTSFGNSRKCL